MAEALARGRMLLAMAGGIAAVAFATSALLLLREGAGGRAATSAVVPAIVLGFLGLAARYPCRAIPLRSSSVSRIAVTHGVSGAAAAALWIAVWQSWTTIDVPLFFGLGMMLYLMSVALHYLVIEIDSAREAERAALRYEVLAREAELKAFKAQIDPHFLYNSLNAVASLCGSRPQDAREMSQLLADFFRQTLRLGANETIELSQEIDLVTRYLAIEKIRFGSRLDVEIAIDESVGKTVVPPLLLQPLVENAVRHGISSMLNGGTVKIDAKAYDGLVRIVVRNPADADRPRASGEGIGLANVRGRLHAMYGSAAMMRAEESGGEYRVEIEVPR